MSGKNGSGKRIPHCPIRYSLDLLAGKWILPIICQLSSAEVMRWGEIKRALGGVTNTMLAASLTELQEAGLVERVQYNEMPLRVEYSLTASGRSLAPIIADLGKWGVKVLASKNSTASSSTRLSEISVGELAVN